MRRALSVGLLLGAFSVMLLFACATSYGDASDLDAGGVDGQAIVGDSASIVTAPPAEGSDASDAGDDFPRTALVHVGPADFSIEATEVTVAQFRAFKVVFPPPAEFARCADKTALGPSLTCAGASIGDRDPVTCVDWCDADAYCTAIGRHLCARIGGGSLPIDSVNDSTSDEWYYACSGPEGLPYAFGDASVGDPCVTDLDAAVTVGSRLQCEGAFPGLFDMNGNAAEWTDACNGDLCSVRGGSYETKAPQAECTSNVVASASSAFRDIGFRCCTEP